MHRKLVLIIVILTLIIPVKSFGVGTVGVQPLNIDLELQPGKKGEFSIDVYSTSNEDTPVSVSLFDIDQKEDGNVDFTEPGKSPFSCAKWIKLQRNDFIVNAGETVELKGEINVPRDASGVRVATIMIEPAYEKKEKGITVKLRYAVILKVKVKGKNLIESGKTQDIRLKLLPDGTPIIETSLINNSNIDYRATGKVVLHDSSGKIIETIALTTHYLEEKQKREKQDNNVQKQTKKKGLVSDEEGQRIFPGAKVNFFGRISKPLKEGEYTAIVSMKFGKRTITAKDKIFFSSDLVSSLKNEEKFLYTIKQQNIEIKVPKGGSRSAFVNIINESDRQIQLRLDLKDVEYTEDGERVIKEIGTTTYTLKELVKLEDKNLTIEPRQTKSLKFDVKVPSNFHNGGRYGQIVVENDGSEDKKFIDVSVIIPDKFENQAEITGFEIKGSEDRELDLHIKNNSKIHIVPEGKVLIMDSDENKLALLNLKGQRLLPGLTMKMNGKIDKKLKKGKYFAVAEIDYGGKEKLTKKIEFNVN
ncbi:MAG: hypothetical protein N2202_04195 [Proteobacteria bacterium]|nr:hypothetical protein [Pseudomonadota bacterium]